MDHQRVLRATISSFGSVSPLLHSTGQLMPIRGFPSGKKLVKIRLNRTCKIDARGIGMENANHWRFLPAEGRLVEPEEQRTIETILKSARVADLIPCGSETLVEIGRRLSASLSVAAAHNEWREPYFDELKTPSPLPRQMADARTPEGLVHVTISSIDQRTPRMDSHFGFKGYFLSLLVSLTEHTIWDARGERAT